MRRSDCCAPSSARDTVGVPKLAARTASVKPSEDARLIEARPWAERVESQPCKMISIRITWDQPGRRSILSKGSPTLAFERLARPEVTKRNLTVIVSDRNVPGSLPAPADRRDQNLFVYGSLVDPRCLDDVLGYHFGGERVRAQLRGFLRVRSDGFHYPFLLAQKDGVVDGILIMGLSPRDMDVLDRYEEVDSGFYTRASIQDVEVWG